MKLARGWMWGALLLCAPVVEAQVANPADAAGASATTGAQAESQEQGSTASSSESSSEAVAAEHLPSWKIPGETVEVVGQAPLREEELIGVYKQPRWTAKRRFGETRVYVRPKGDLEFEYWLAPEFPRYGGDTEIAQQYELEFGLPHRFQLDLYAVSNQEGNQGAFAFDQSKLELRYALADWGAFWGNPTLYLEWNARSNEPDHLEGKLLLGGQAPGRLHWGANLVFEHEMGGAQENAYELTVGLSRTVRDEKLSVGGEVKYALSDVESDRGNYATDLLVGPSLQVRPLPQAHLDLVALAGIGSDSPSAKLLLIFGWEL